jgi:hypothetical protein
MARFIMRLPTGQIPQPSMYTTDKDCCEIGEILRTANGRRWRVIEVAPSTPLGRSPVEYGGVLTVERLEHSDE